VASRLAEWWCWWRWPFFHHRFRSVHGAEDELARIVRCKDCGKEVERTKLPMVFG
jgi:hypothetical protein